MVSNQIPLGLTLKNHAHANVHVYESTSQTSGSKDGNAQALRCNHMVNGLLAKATATCQSMGNGDPGFPMSCFRAFHVFTVCMICCVCVMSFLSRLAFHKTVAQSTGISNRSVRRPDTQCFRNHFTNISRWIVQSTEIAQPSNARKWACTTN